MKPLTVQHLIFMLEKLKHKYGNLPVMVRYADGWDAPEVEIEQDENGDPLIVIG